MDKYALLGYPLSHSYSPLIHNLMFKQKNIDATYELKPLLEEELNNAIDLLRKGEYKGYNVTIPYKVKIMEYLDEITPNAREIGSVNTVYCSDGKVIGDNTDYYGFIEQLKYNNVDCKHKNCYILGTGGASLAVSKALKDLEANVYFVSRTKRLDVLTYDEFNEIEDIDLIVNATPVGMYPNVFDSPISEKCASKANTIVDIIFNPSITKLMSYNPNSYNGLPMLVFQAAKAQDIWLGQKFEIEEREILDRVRGELNE